MTPLIRRILCPVDFSPHSACALQQALALGAWYGARVSVLHVHGAAEPLDFVDRDRIATELRTFVTTEASGERDVQWRLEEAADVRRAIVARAAAEAADMIVMGTHGRSGFQRFLLGSIAERVLRTSHVPVLVVPPGAASARFAGAGIARIVCGTDFSAGSARALGYAAGLAVQAKAALTVVHIVELPSDLHEDPTLDLLRYRSGRFERARGPLLAAIAPLRETCQVEPLLLAGRASAEIVRLAEEQQADLIVLGVHGRGTVDRMVFGSVTEQVMRHAGCPLLTVPEPSAGGR